MENKSLLGWVIGAFLLGGILSKAIPITNTNSNGNTITISQEVPTENLKNIEKISKNSENIENFQENSEKSRKIQENSGISEKKLNINIVTFQEISEAKVGIGETKFKKLVSGRPYKSVEELRTKKIIGKYAYDKHKHKFTVGD